MFERFLFTVAITFALGSLNSYAITPKESPSPNNTWEKAKLALFQNNRSMTIERYLTNNTFDWFTTLKNTAIKGCRSNTENLKPVERFIVLTFRASHSPVKLKNISLDSAIKNDFKDNLSQLSDFENARLKNVSINGSNASGDLTIRNIPNPVKIYFIKEDEDWKINIPPVAKQFESYLTLLPSTVGLDLNQFMIFSISQAFGEPYGEELLSGPECKQKI